MNKYLVMTMAASLCVSAFAGDFTFRAGYAWRSRVKTSYNGGSSALPTSGVYDDGHVTPGTTDWSGPIVDDVVADPTMPGNYLYALALTQQSAVSGHDGDESMHGGQIDIGYDFWEVGPMTIGLNTHFAGYWNLQNRSSGGCSRYTDYFPFVTGPFPGAGTPSAADFDEPSEADLSYRKYLTGGAVQTMRLKADLYQLGLGPQATWHVFDWLDAYGNMMALCNIIKTDFDVGGASKSDTNCKLGFGGNLGLTAYLTDNLGLYGQVGYEWIDKNDVSAGGIRASTDYSSLVLSAGLSLRF